MNIAVLSLKLFWKLYSYTKYHTELEMHDYFQCFKIGCLLLMDASITYSVLAKLRCVLLRWLKVPICSIQSLHWKRSWKKKTEKTAHLYHKSRDNERYHRFKRLNCYHWVEKHDSQWKKKHFILNGPSMTQSVCLNCF